MDYTYENCKVARVVDGDTVYITLRREYKIDFGFKIFDTVVKETTQDFRLAGINCPEMVGATKAAGQAAKDHLISLLAHGDITVKSLKADKYGRYLAEISITISQPSKDGFGELEKKTFSVNKAMIDAGHAIPYMATP